MPVGSADRALSCAPGFSSADSSHVRRALAQLIALVCAGLKRYSDAGRRDSIVTSHWRE